MNYQTLTYIVTAEGIAIVTLNRPDKMNALNVQMRAEIAHAVTRAGKESRVLVMTGAGGAFCTGQDLGDGATAANIDLERTLRDEYTPICVPLRIAPCRRSARSMARQRGQGPILHWPQTW